MKQSLLLIFMICFGIIFPSLSQQTPEPTPIFPPNPEDIFVDGVNWALVENTTQTNTYSIIESNCVNAFQRSDNRSGRWQWHIVYDPEIRKYLVCFDETLETYDILLDGYDYEEWEVYGNPNNEWLILIGRDFYDWGFYQVFSYHLPTAQQNFLGKIKISVDTSVWVDGWLNDTLGVMGSSIWGYKTPFMSYYRFDVEVPESLEFALSGGYGSQNIIKLDSPSRYVAFYPGGYYEYQEGHSTCRMVVLDATGIYHHELGYECLTTFFIWGEITIPFYQFGNGVIYYITISQEDDSLAELHRYDAHYLPNELNQPFPIFLGAIERVLSVSPDEQYIVLQMSNDDVINSTYLGWSCCSAKMWRQPITIIKRGDVANYEFSRWLYESEPLVVPFTSQLAWLDDKTLVILSLDNDSDTMLITRQRDSIPNPFPASLRRIELNEDYININITTKYSVSSYHVAIDDFLFYTSPNNRYWLNNRTVIDLRTFEEITILKEGVHSLYSIHLRWSLTDEAVLRVTICPTQCTSQNQVVYQITL